MRHEPKIIGLSIIGMLMLTSNGFAQTVTNPITSNSTSNPVSNLDQSGALINTQINSHQLGRSIVGNGIADCTTSGISASTFGSAVGPFDSGTFGGAVTYTHSFGMKTCKRYAKTQLGKLRLETCLLLISNYSKMRKAGIAVDYQQLMDISDIDCPTVDLIGLESSSTTKASNNQGLIPPQTEAPQPTENKRPILKSPTSLKSVPDKEHITPSTEASHLRLVDVKEPNQ